MLINIHAEALGKQIPKHLLTLSECEHALASPQLVKRLRRIGALTGKREGQLLLFRADHVAEVAARYLAGEYDAKLAEI